MMNVAIGQAARLTGVKIPTIRYYEQVGLLAAPERSNSRRRLYGEADLRRLTFIRHARELGFEVDAIRTLLSLQDDPGQSCETADEIARARLLDVEQRIAGLLALKSELTRMLDQCSSGRIADCRVIETLADQSHRHGRLT